MNQDRILNQQFHSGCDSQKTQSPMKRAMIIRWIDRALRAEMMWKKYLRIFPDNKIISLHSSKYDIDIGLLREGLFLEDSALCYTSKYQTLEAGHGSVKCFVDRETWDSKS
jgi:hypothetical protein